MIAERAAQWPMSVDPELRSLDIDIPSQPESLVKLSLLLAEDEVNLQAVAALIETTWRWPRR
jgi:HD-like signal output (HDOD) protein